MSGCLDTTTGACIQCSLEDTTRCTQCASNYNLVDGACYLISTTRSATTSSGVGMAQATYIAVLAIVMIVMAVFHN